MSDCPHNIREVRLIVSDEMQGLSMVVRVLNWTLQNMVLDSVKIKVNISLPIDSTHIYIKFNLVFRRVVLDDFVLIADIKDPFILSEVAEDVSPLLSSAY